MSLIRGFTLTELIIAVSLLGIVVIGVTGINLASRRSFISASRRARVQNEARFTMEHMVRNIRLGNRVDPSSGGSATNWIQVWVDDDNTPRDSGDDTRLWYNLEGNRVRFRDSDRGIDEFITPVNPKTGIGYIANLTFTIVNQPVRPVYLTIDLTAAYDPSAYDPSSVDPNNPGVTLHAGVTLRCKAKD